MCSAQPADPCPVVSLIIISIIILHVCKPLTQDSVEVISQFPTHTSSQTRPHAAPNEKILTCSRIHHQPPQQHPRWPADRVPARFRLGNGIWKPAAHWENWGREQAEGDPLCHQPFAAR
ncbi:hypothetical protein TgHK011_000211 [Trichoderma gracile]|nr:hypothetical protein TgHK011_000211 [Trichoderma gracile]